LRPEFKCISEDELARPVAAHPQAARWLINTHWHFDHTDGNAAFAAAGATILAHANCRFRLSREQYVPSLSWSVSAAPRRAWPQSVQPKNKSFRVRRRASPTKTRMVVGMTSYRRAAIGPILTSRAEKASSARGRLFVSWSKAWRYWRVNKPENDDASILDEIELATEAAKNKMAREAGIDGLTVPPTLLAVADEVTTHDLTVCWKRFLRCRDGQHWFKTRLRDARKIHNHQALDSNIAHRTSDFEFFSKLLAVSSTDGNSQTSRSFW
jgi:hypothetical protein